MTPCRFNDSSRRLHPIAISVSSPLFQVTFSIEPPMPGLGPQWDISEMDAGTSVSKFDLSIELEDRGEIIAGRAIYSLDLFEASTISQLVLRLHICAQKGGVRS